MWGDGMTYFLIIRPWSLIRHSERKTKREGSGDSWKGRHLRRTVLRLLSHGRRKKGARERRQCSSNFGQRKRWYNSKQPPPRENERVGEGEVGTPWGIDCENREKLNQRKRTTRAGRTLSALSTTADERLWLERRWWVMGQIGDLRLHTPAY